MTISSTVRKAGPYPGNGAAVTFPFSFKVFEAADVLVVRAVESSGVETELAITTDYAVTLNANQDTSPGGSVTLPAPLAAGYTLTIASQVTETQPAVFTNTGGFYPSVLNASLDRLTALVQQLSEKVGRAIKVPISSAADATADYLLALLFGAADQAGESATAAAASAAGAAGSASAAAASAATASGAANNTILRDGSRTMTGPLTLAGNATNALEAVPKQQVDLLLSKASNLSEVANAAAALANLGGVAPSAFTGTNQLLATSGYQKLPGGLILQWGYLAATLSNFSFPLAFPSTCFAVFATNADGQGGSVDNAYAYPINNAQFHIATKRDGGGTSGFPCFWFAVGI